MALDRTDAGRAVFAQFLRGEVAELIDRVRGVVTDNLSPGERVNATLPDGTVIGTVTIGKPAEAARVTDERALLDWVKSNRPDEIVESVRTSYVDQLKRDAKVHGYPVDKSTGEIIPGVELVEGSPSYRPVVDKGAVPVLRQRLAEIVSQGLLELPGGES